MPHIATDADGFIVATNSDPGIHNPLTCPEGGSLATCSAEQLEKIVATFDAGKRAKLDGEEVIAEDYLPPQKRSVASEEDVRKLRRVKMQLISDTSVSSRGRKFDAFPYVPPMHQERHVDTLFMYVTGKLKDTDTTLMRNLNSGEYETITLAEWADQMEKSYQLRQKLRERDQLYRDQVNAIYLDAKITDEEKLTLIEAIVVPEYLDVDEKKSTDQALVTKVSDAKG